MKRFLVSVAVTLLLGSAWSDGASAQRHGFGGGARFGGGGFHGGGMRIGGDAFRGGAWGLAGRPGWGALDAQDGALGGVQDGGRGGGVRGCRSAWMGGVQGGLMLGGAGDGAGAFRSQSVSV